MIKNLSFYDHTGSPIQQESKMSQRQAIIRVLALCALSFMIGRVDGQKRDYRGYSVFRCKPQTSEQLAKLQALNSETRAGLGIEFWTEPLDLRRSVDVMVEPDYKYELEQKLKIWDISNEEIISNLAEEIARSSPPPLSRNSLASNSTLRAQMLSSEQYHRQYHPYAEIEAKLEQLAAMDPRISLNTIGRSSEGRNLYLVKVSSDPAANKPVILIDGGHHAREWISHATVIYILESLVNIDIPRLSASSCRDERCRQALARRTKLSLDDYDYWFVPVVNPDGYEHTHRYDRLWRKTRSKTACWGGAGGVDPNRNYPFHWMEAGASKNSCSDIYAGPRPQSEPEVQAVVQVMDANKGRIVMYLSFHSYSQLILAPYGYGRVYPDNYEDLKTVAGSWIETTSSLRDTQYQFGTSAILLYPAAGGSDDYAHGAADIKFAYTIELPDKGRRGFVLPQSEIIPVGQETVMGINSMIRTMERITKRP